MFGLARQLAGRLKESRPVRAYFRYDRLRGNRLAGAVSFYGFVALFPLLIIAAAVIGRALGRDRAADLQEIVDENLPGIAESLNVQGFVDRAGTIGLVSGVLLLWTGLSWVDAVRAAVRSMWEKDDQPGNVVERKTLDVLALAGLGLVLAVSWAASVFVGSAADEIFDELGFGIGAVLRRVLALSLAILSSSVLFAYLLTGLPRVRVPWRVLVPMALIGGLVFELLKQVVTQFAVVVAPDNTYAAFAVPLALLAWIYLVTRLLMLLAAFSAEWASDHAGHTVVVQAA
jgi:membrane protein